MIGDSFELKTKEEITQKATSVPDSMHLSLLEYQENERNRIARDIHDSTVQNLTSLIHKVELCTKLIELSIDALPSPKIELFL
jgi:signal transduction histidine kinase